MAAAAHVALNRLRAGYGGAKSLAEVINQPHQFTGMARANQVKPEDYATAQAVADQVLAGQVPDPTGGAMAFLNPELTQQLYGKIPAWAQGPGGQRIGRHVFFGGGQQVAQNTAAPPGPPAPPDPNGPDIQSVGGGGADPFAPPPPQVPQAPVPQAAPQAPIAPLALPPNWPTWKPSADEVNFVHELLMDPRRHAEGVQAAIKMRQKMAEPVEATVQFINGAPFYVAKDPTSGAPVMAIPVPKEALTKTVPGSSPSDFAQLKPTGEVTHQAIPGVQGPVPEGTVLKNGVYTHVPTDAQQTFRLPGANGLFVMGPDGQPKKVADDQYGPEQLLRMRNELLTSEPVKRFQEASDAYGAMRNVAIQNPNGMRAYALMDTYARAINPGAVARPQVIEAIKNARGIPEEVRGFFLNLKGDGNLPPATVQHILDATQAFVASHYKNAKQLVDSNTDYARRHNLDPSDVTVPLPDAPERFVLKAPAASAAPAANAPRILQYDEHGRLRR
jgi:hypothetical protein